MERAKRSGADGTPLVAEFAAMELGAVLGMGHVAAGHYLRDAVNVRHRHPLLWAALAEGRGRVWQARQIAQACATAGLDAGQARWVDAATTRYVGSLPWGRLEGLVAAKIVEADPDAAEERRVAAALARFVRTGQSSEYGLKTLVARANAGDVIFFVAMVDRIAQILLERGDVDPADVRRSKAIGILAVPARAVALLEWGAANATAAADDPDPAGDGEDADSDDAPGATSDNASRGHDDDEDAGEDPELIGEADVHPSQNDADDPAPEPAPCPTCAGAGQVTGDPTAFVRPQVDPRKLLPDATLYVHLSEEALRTGRGVAWMEGIGPITLGQVVEFLGHTHVRTVPVRDLADDRAVDGHRPPEWMAETLHLRNPACVSPWSSNLSRKKDKDHNRPYVPPDDGGPPGQTRLDNLAPLHRFPHRVKTHGRWRLRQTSPGVYEWRTPHGYRYRVDATGTHPLGKDTGHDAGNATGNDGTAASPHLPERPGGGRLEHRLRNHLDSCRRRPRPGPTRTVTITRVGNRWMETYETDLPVEIDRSFTLG
jgi:hypothetical protein